jgi:hypothetical protein
MYPNAAKYRRIVKLTICDSLETDEWCKLISMWKDVFGEEKASAVFYLSLDDQLILFVLQLRPYRDAH